MDGCSCRLAPVLAGRRLQWPGQRKRCAGRDPSPRFRFITGLLSQPYKTERRLAVNLNISNGQRHGVITRQFAELWLLCKLPSGQNGSYKLFIDLTIHKHAPGVGLSLRTAGCAADGRIGDRLVGLGKDSSNFSNLPREPSILNSVSTEKRTNFARTTQQTTQ